jgi:hypothetical protein
MKTLLNFQFNKNHVVDVGFEGPMRVDRYCGFGPWTQHGLYSIDIALGELINIKDINYDRSINSSVSNLSTTYTHIITHIILSKHIHIQI